jgi:hypothetical protein
MNPVRVEVASGLGQHSSFGTKDSQSATAAPISDAGGAPQMGEKDTPTFRQRMMRILIRAFVALVFIAIGMWLGFSVLPDMIISMLSGKP